MSAVQKAVPETATSLAEIVERTPSLVLMDREKFDEFYDEIAEEVRAFVPDLTTDKGRKEVASLAFRVTKTKTAIDEAGKKLSEDKRREVRLIDEARKAIRDRLEDLRDEARKPLTDWEAAESVRREARERDINELGIAAIVAPEDTSDTIAARLDMLEKIRIDEATFQEFAASAESTRRNGIEVLTGALDRVRRQEADRAELARLRAEAAERERIDAERLAAERAEQARIERERIEAEVARDEERRRVEAEEAERHRVAEAVEQARVEAEERHAAELRRIEEERAAERRDRERAEETQRLAAERIEREQREAEEARQRDRAHRSKIMAAAKEALMEAGALPEATARIVVQAIAAGDIPNVSIKF